MLEHRVIRLGLAELPWAGARAPRLYGQDGTSVLTREIDGAWLISEGDEMFRVENHVLGTDAPTFFGSLRDPGQDIFAAKVSILFRPG